MNACDIYCIPSRNEPFGITVLEAWTAKKPVLGTNAISINGNNKVKKVYNWDRISDQTLEVYDKILT